MLTDAGDDEPERAMPSCSGMPRCDEFRELSMSAIFYLSNIEFGSGSLATLPAEVRSADLGL